MACSIIATADELEPRVRSFLETNPTGGRFDLPDVGIEFLVIPLILATFEMDGWSGEYDFNEGGEEWITFSREG